MLKANHSNRGLTTIALSWENYETLRELGKTGDSFNDVVTKILSGIQKTKPKNGEYSKT